MKTQLLEWIESNETEFPFLAALKLLATGVIIADKMGNIVFWNEGATLQFGYDRDEVVGHNLMMLMPDRFVTEHVNAMKNRRESPEKMPSKIIGNTVDIFGRRKDLTEFPIQLSVAEHVLNETPCYLATITDVSAARENEGMKLVQEALEQVTKNQTGPSVIA